jgi:hypothetical protein
MIILYGKKLTYLSIVVAGIGLGFLLGQYTERKFNVEQCKLAGWDFIEERIFPKRMVKKTIYASKEQQRMALMDLQSNIATKCIVRIDR